MDITKLIQVLSEALDDKDWDVIKELLEDLIYEEENPIKEYERDSDLDEENLWGWLGNRLVLFDTKVQQSLSRLLNKTQRNLNGDNSLDGLVIDWHLAGAEMGFDNYVEESVSDSQPTYAYA